MNGIAVATGLATITVRLGYQTSEAAAVFGAAAVDPGQLTTLTGEYYQSDLLPPITYQWYQAGALLSGETGTSLQAQGGAPNTPVHYEFRVTDSQGRTVTAGHTLMTTAGCGAQIECD